MILFALLLALWVAAAPAQAQQSQPGNCSGTATATAAPIVFSPGFPSRFLTISNPSTTATLWICASKGCTAAANAATSIALSPVGGVGQNRISFWRGALSPPAAVSILSSAAQSPFTCLYDGADVPTYPLDAFTQPAAAYSMRRLKSTYTGPALRLRRASDNAETDINFLGFVPGLGALLDVAAANAHCAATSCFITGWYDQSGNGRHFPAPGPAGQSALQFNCQNGLPCARNTLGTSQGMGVAGVPSGAVLTLNMVGRVPVRGSASCQWFFVGTNQFVPHPTLDLVTLSNGATAFNAAATTTAMHAYTATMNGASSVINVDGTETTGTTAAIAGGSNALYFVGNTGATCDNAEMVYWDNYVLTAPERAAIGANQRSFWGIP